jgi:hypothetical protein
MTDRELMKQALEALEKLTIYDSRSSSIWRYFYPSATGDYVNLREFKELSEPIVNALKAALAQPEQEPVAHSVIAGALFDFMGWLTSRRKRIVLSSADNASPSVEAITEFAKMRGLSLDDAKVQDWNIAPPQRKPLTDEEIKLQALNAELVEALTEICECPQWVDDATVPKAGIDSAPQQVVVNMSVALTRIRKARAVIAKATGEKE